MSSQRRISVSFGVGGMFWIDQRTEETVVAEFVVLFCSISQAFQHFLQTVFITYTYTFPSQTSRFNRCKLFRIGILISQLKHISLRSFCVILDMGPLAEQQEIAEIEDVLQEYSQQGIRVEEENKCLGNIKRHAITGLHNREHFLTYYDIL